MSFEPREYLRHILAEADYLLGRRSGLSPEAFEADETLRRAFARSLEVIGEAAKQVPEEYRARHPRVEWRAMTRSRRSWTSGDDISRPAAWSCHLSSSSSPAPPWS